MPPSLCIPILASSLSLTSPGESLQGKNEEPFSRLNGKAGHTELKGYMSLKIEKQKVKNGTESLSSGDTVANGPTHAIDQGPGSLA